MAAIQPEPKAKTGGIFGNKPQSLHVRKAAERLKAINRIAPTTNRYECNKNIIPLPKLKNNVKTIYKKEDDLTKSSIDCRNSTKYKVSINSIKPAKPIANYPAVASNRIPLSTPNPKGKETIISDSRIKVLEKQLEEAQLQAEQKIEKLNNKIYELIADFEAERKDLKDRIRAEQDKSNRTKFELESFHHEKVSKLENEIAELGKLKTTDKCQIFQVKKHLTENIGDNMTNLVQGFSIQSLYESIDGTSGMEMDTDSRQCPGRANELFKVLEDNIHGNLTAWNQVENFCRKLD